MMKNDGARMQATAMVVGLTFERRLLHTLLGVMGITLATAWQAVAAPGDGPRAVVQETSDAVVAVLADKGLTADDKRAKIEAIADERFDFETLSRLVLARNWKQLSPAQQVEFTREFRRHLSVTYGKNVESYNNERVVIIGDRSEMRGDWTVQSRIARPGGEDFRVDYRLRKHDGIWKMIDVIIEGVSLVANFRSQFQEIVSKRGVTGLIEVLREKTAKGESFESPQSPRSTPRS